MNGGHSICNDDPSLFFLGAPDQFGHRFVVQNAIDAGKIFIVRVNIESNERIVGKSIISYRLDVLGDGNVVQRTIGKCHAPDGYDAVWNGHGRQGGRSNECICSDRGDWFVINR